MRIDIFCESGAKFGLGHFYRCIKLIALCLKTKKAHSITLHNRGDFIPPALSTLLGEDIQGTIECKNYEWLSTQPQMLDIAFIDSYEAQEWFYYRIKAQSKALICLDDTLRDVYPPKSYILNPTPNCTSYFSKDYHLWCGKDYMIPPITLPSKAHTLEGNYRHIFVSFGGADVQNLTQSFLNALATLPIEHLSTLCFHIILGNAYTHKPIIKEHIAPSLHLHYHLSPKAFLALAQECSYAISAGGGSMLELIALKIPSIIIESAPNQHFHITQWQKEGAIAKAEHIHEALLILQDWLMQDSTNTLLHSITSVLASLSLGNQLSKALCALFTQLSDESTQNSLLAINFTELTQEQSHLVLSMRNHPDIAQWMYASHITPSSHTQFLQHLSQDHSKRYWLFKEDSQYIGVGSLTRINIAHKHAYLGVYINPFCGSKSKGMRIMEFLESFARNELALHTLHLEVLSHNERALRFYKKCGYIQEGLLHDFAICKENGEKRYCDVILMYKELQ